MEQTPQSAEVAQQQAAIDGYLAKEYFAGRVKSCGEIDLLTMQPVGDTELEALYEDAHGDPVHYAIKMLINSAEYKLRYVQDKFPITEDIDIVRAHIDAQQIIDSYRRLENQYVDPINYPFDQDTRP